MFTINTTPDQPFTHESTTTDLLHILIFYNCEKNKIKIFIAFRRCCGTVRRLKKSIVIKFILAPPAPSAKDRLDRARPINDDDMQPEWCHRSLMGSMHMMMMEYNYARISKPMQWNI